MIAKLTTLDNQEIEFPTECVGLVTEISDQIIRMDIGDIGSVYLYGTVHDIVKKYQLDHNMLIGCGFK